MCFARIMSNTECKSSERRVFPVMQGVSCYVTSLTLCKNAIPYEESPKSYLINFEGLLDFFVSEKYTMNISKER